MVSSIVHIINPVKVTENSDLSYAQPITFESMLRAKEACEHSDRIQLCTTQFEEDRSIIPSSFRQLSNLTRSVLDANTQLRNRKLPLIADILAKVSEVPEAEYIIFTNMDIALMPYFYDTVYAYIAKGHDSIIINRRRLASSFTKIEELPLMYAALGKSHPGFDCFVIKRELLNQFIMADICVGISFLEATLVHNIFAFAQNPLYVPDAHLTFHIGMDVLVPRKSNPFYWHNRSQFFKQIYPQLKDKFALEKFPYASLPLHKRVLKWGLNPSLFTRNYIDLQGKTWRQKMKHHLDELRWRILQE